VGEIVDVLRGRIAGHVLLPGSRLQELALAREFNVSRAVVREVLAVLVQRGLVKRLPNKGAIVNRLDAKEVYEVFDVREVLEGLCVRLATIHAPEHTWDKMAEQFGEPLREAIAAGDIEKYVAALDELRTMILRWADNSHASHFLDLILDKARMIKLRVTLLPGRAEVGRIMHLEMLELMAERDAEGSENKKKEIIRSAREWAERYKNFIM